MKLGIMQPYFFPYIGYFQLMNAVDEFVVYDNIKYTKTGWINRNRILANGKESFITVPLNKGSDYLMVKDRCLAHSWPSDRIKIMNRINESYRKAPRFDYVYPLIHKCLHYNDYNLFDFILYSLKQIKEYLLIPTPLIISSTISIEEDLKGRDKVIAICKEKRANEYYNPIGGIELYMKSDFKKEGIDLYFLKATDCKYKQFDNEYVPWLSIIDVMMFNSQDEIKNLLYAFHTL